MPTEATGLEHVTPVKITSTSATERAGFRSAGAVAPCHGPSARPAGGQRQLLPREPRAPGLRLMGRKRPKEVAGSSSSGSPRGVSP